MFLSKELLQNDRVEAKVWKNVLYVGAVFFQKIDSEQ